MVINDLSLRKRLENKAKSSLTRLYLIKNKASKKLVRYCYSNSYDD
jgi:hypothetical protein